MAKSTRSRGRSSKRREETAETIETGSLPEGAEEATGEAVAGHAGTEDADAPEAEAPSAGADEGSEAVADAGDGVDDAAPDELSGGEKTEETEAEVAPGAAAAEPTDETPIPLDETVGESGEAALPTEAPSDDVLAEEAGADTEAPADSTEEATADEPVGVSSP